MTKYIICLCTATACILNSGTGLYDPLTEPPSPLSNEHIIEESLRQEPEVFSKGLNCIKMEVQYLDSVQDDNDEDISFKPEEIVDHRIDFTPHKSYVNDPNHMVPMPVIHRIRHMHTKVK